MARFSVSAVWDEEAGVFHSKSDIVGLHIEAPTIEEFEEVMLVLAPEMVVENHIDKADMASKSLLDLIPSIVFDRPPPVPARDAVS